MATQFSVINTNFVGYMMFPHLSKFVRDPNAKRRLSDAYTGIIEFGEEDDGSASLPVSYALDLSNGGGNANASQLASSVPDGFKTRPVGDKYYTGYALFVCKRDDVDALLENDNGLVATEGTYTDLATVYDRPSRSRKKFTYPAMEMWGKNAVRLYGAFSANAPQAFGARAYAGTSPIEGLDSDIWKITLIESPYPDGILRYKRRTHNFSGIVVGVIETRRMAWGNPASYADALTELMAELDADIAEEDAAIAEVNDALRAIDDKYTADLAKYAEGSAKLNVVHEKYREADDTEENDIAYANELQAIWLEYSDNPSWTPTDENGNARPLPNSILLGTTPAAKKNIERRPLLEQRRLIQQERNRKVLEKNPRLERLEDQLVREQRNQGESLADGRARIFSEKIADLNAELHGEDIMGG